MAFNFGAAATGVGSLADAFEANRRQALEERRQKVMDAQQAQRERYQNAYQQALIQKQQDERQYEHLLYKFSGGTGSLRTAGTGKPQWKVDSGGNAYWVYPPDEQNPDGVQVP